MNRRLIIPVLLLVGIQMLAFAAVGDEIPGSIRNNRYFLESVRLTNLAEQAYEEGDYDASSRYSQEAVRYAELSDEYVRLQLKIKETDDAIAAARRRMDFAASVNAASRYPYEYSQAQAAYTEARAFRTAESWDDAIRAANRVVSALAFVSADAPSAETVVEKVTGNALPSQYTVRSWSSSLDCFWNIASRPWVYNDPWKWKILYDANKSRLPNPNNPDLMEPGMVLDIPSIKGEARQGAWNANQSYPSLP